MVRAARRGLARSIEMALRCPFTTAVSGCSRSGETGAPRLALPIGCSVTEAKTAEKVKKKESSVQEEKKDVKEAKKEK